MARVVPSQIVDVINQTPVNFASSRIAVNLDSAGGLIAIARLVDEIPVELLAISGTDYSDLVSGVETIRNSVAFWHHTGQDEIGMSGIRGKNVLGCSDEFCSGGIPARPNF
jgi:hypothetical protein